MAQADQREGQWLARSGAAWVAAGTLAVGFVLLVVPPILAGLDTMLQHGDMAKFHLPQVNQHIASPLAFFEYEATSATTPGHHFFLAYAAMLMGYDAVGEGDLPIRFLNALFGLAVVLLSYRIFLRLGRDVIAAAALSLPLLGSNYVIAASIWVNTDNGATVWYLACLWTLLFHAHVGWRAFLFPVLLVFWRQIYLPATGAFGLMALWPGKLKTYLPLGVLAALPPLMLVGAYAYAWQGLTPGTTQYYNKATVNPSVPLHALAMIGLLGAAYLPILVQAVRSWPRKELIRLVGASLLVPMFLWIVADSNYDGEMGRWGSVVWLLAGKLPTVGTRSPVVLLLAWAGAAAAIAMGVRAYRERYYPAELALLGLYLLGYSFQVFAWQRYVEPAILITLGVFAVRVREVVPRWAFLGPAAIGLLFGTLNQLRVWGVVGRMLG